MSRQSSQLTRAYNGTSVAVGFGASLTLVVAYLFLRYGVATQWALVVSQFLFLSPILVAVVFSARAVLLAPTTGRARLIWTLFTLALSLLTFYEVIDAMVMVTGRTDSPTALLLADAAAVLATLTFLAIVGTISAVERLDRGRAMRVALDIVAIGTLIFGAVFRFWVVDLLDLLDFSQAVEAVRLAAYASVGILVVVANHTAMRRIRRQGSYRWVTWMGAGITVYGAGVALWPLWALRAFEGTGPWWHEPLVAAVLLVGYELFALGAMVRVNDASGPWWDAAPSPETGAVWPGLIATTLVFAAVFFLGWAALDAPRGTPEELVYLTVLSVAVICLVMRTALSSAEMWRLQSLAATDAVTGGYSQRLLNERLSELVTVSDRSGEPFGLAVVNLDDFSALNQAYGHDVGDRVLAAVNVALADSADTENVFRTFGDEFVALVPSWWPNEAERHAAVLLSAIESVEVEGARISASLGVATYPVDADSGEDLLRKASAAQVWAKYHGKRRVERYDKGLLRVSSGRGGYALLEEQGSLEVALALVALNDALDPRAYRHARNVASLSRMLAGYAGLDAGAADRIEVAAMMHDIGRVAVVPKAGSGRSGSMARRAAEREHPSVGARLVASLGLADVPVAVRSHHERWDGQGYPDGLAAKGIPLGARIIALADAYDTMTGGTGTDLAMSKGAALQEVDLGIGTRFDPRLAELFIALVGTTESLGWREDWTIE